MIFPPPPLTTIEAPRSQKSSPEPPFRAYKRAGPAPHLATHHPNRASLPLKPPSTATTDHHNRPPPAAVDPPLQSTPAQGKERNQLPSTSSSFRPTSRPSPRTGSPAPLPPPPVDLPVFCASILYREGGEEEDGCFAHTPCPFSTSPKPTPLYSLFPFFQIRP
jgi:hypothetical protein